MSVPQWLIIKRSFKNADINKAALDNEWKMRHGYVGQFLDWLTVGLFARYVFDDPRPGRAK